MPQLSPAVSVVAPCYNEAAVLPALIARLDGALAGFDAEIVLVNDGSSDRTWELIGDYAARDPRVVAVNLSRNYGHQLALTAGLAETSGAVVLVIDADLQDPPEALAAMLALMEQTGADVVYGQRTARPGETLLKRATASLFYRLMNWLADAPLPRDAGDFRLMTRRVVDHFLAMPERHRYVRGMVSWIGYQQVAYPYERSVRAAGETHYTFSKMARFAADAVAGFSVKPLALAFRGAGLCGFAAVAILIASAVWGVRREQVPTGGLLAGLILMLGAGQFLALGIIGEYLGRVAEQARGRPLYVVESVVRARTAAQPKFVTRHVA